MKFLRFFLLVCAAALAFQGCKEEEETTKSYLDGTLTLAGSMPQYVNAGQKYVFVPSGLSASDSTHIAYYFSDTYSSRKDTIMAKGHPDTKYTYCIPDTLGTLTLSCTGYAEGSSDYYTSSASISYVIVDPRLNEGTITGFPYFEGDFKVEMYGDEYYCIRVGNRYWMRQNLGYIVGKQGEGWSFGRPYYNSDVMRTIFGGYYTWEEAKKACPEGWRLPTDQEFIDLLKAGGVTCSMEPHKDFEHGAGTLMDWLYFNEEKMWEYYRDVNVTNTTKFTAMPVGYATISDNYYGFTGYGSYAAFWTSDEYEGQGIYRYIYMEKDSVFAGHADGNTFAASVRCVK